MFASVDKLLSTDVLRGGRRFQRLITAWTKVRVLPPRLMPTYANIALATQTPGAVYCSAVAIPTTEADLGTPVVFDYGQAITASVQLVITGGSSPTYFVLQTDFGDGNWIDVAWVTDTTTTSTGITFLLSSNVGGNNGLKQSRAMNNAPASSGSNLMGMGTRFRFTGKTGTVSTATATILYRILGLR